MRQPAPETVFHDRLRQSRAWCSPGINYSTPNSGAGICVMPEEVDKRAGTGRTRHLSPLAMTSLELVCGQLIPMVHTVNRSSKT